MAAHRFKICDSCREHFEDVSRSNRRKRCYSCAPESNARANEVYCKYGISQTEYEVLLNSTDGICPLCKDFPATHIDHDHKTGKVRGILCQQCNAHLGWIEKFDWLNRALDYLENSLLEAD